MKVFYYANWSRFRNGRGCFTPENLNTNGMTGMTHVIYSFALLKELKMKLSQENISDLKKVVNLMRPRGVKVLIAIGGWKDSHDDEDKDKYDRLVGSSSNRANFIADAMNFLDRHGLDGLDLDWEYPTNKQNFTQFVQELSAACKRRNYLLTAAVAAGSWQADISYDIPALASSLDWINLMAYDFHGHWEGKTGHVAPYDEVTSSVSYWQQLGMPARKIVLGIPSYGKSFTLSDPRRHAINAPTSGPGNKGEFTEDYGSLAYYEIMQKVRSNQMTLVNDQNGSYSYGGNQWVSFDSVDNVKRKSRFARNQGHGGVMMWSPDFDDFNNGSPIASAM